MDDDIFDAVMSDDLEAAKAWLEKDPKCLKIATDGLFPIHLCGSAEMVELLLSVGGGLMLNMRTQNNCTPLIVAAQEGEVTVAEYLIQRKAGINFQDNLGNTALHYSCGTSDEDPDEERPPEMTKLLLDNGADPNLKNEKGETALHFASATGAFESMKALLEAKAIVDTPAEGSLSITPLFGAIINGHEDAVDLLLSNGANPNYASDDGGTPVHIAINFNHLEILKKLIMKKGRIWARTKGGQNGLHVACQYGNKEMVTFLFERAKKADNFDWNLPIIDGSSYLQLIVFCNSPIWVNKFLEAGSDPELKMKVGDTALHLACTRKDEKMVILLLENGLNPNAVANNGGTPLIIASQLGLFAAVKELIARRADVNAATKVEKATPLLLATTFKFPKIVKILLENGADPNLSLANGTTALHLAASLKLNTIFKDLLTFGADPLAVFQVPPYVGAQALHCACEVGELEMVQLLLDRNVDVNAPGQEGKSPLYNAAEKGYAELVAFLIEKGAKIDEPATNDKMTPLIAASAFGHAEVMKILLKNGANIESQTVAGITPLMIASELSGVEEVKLLLDHGANISARSIEEGRGNALHYSYSNDDYSVTHLLMQRRAPRCECGGPGVCGNNEDF